MVIACFGQCKTRSSFVCDFGKFCAYACFFKMKIEGEMSRNELNGDCIFSDNARQDCSQQFITFSISSTIIIITVTITTTMFSISEHIIVLCLNLCLYLYYLCQRLAKHSVNVNSQMDGIDHPFKICCHSAFI